MASPLTFAMWPPLIALVALATVAAMVSVVSGAWRDGVWRMVLALTVIGILSMLVAWQGDGQEVTRHTVEGFAELRLGIWIVILLWFLGAPPPRPGDAPSDMTAHRERTVV
jgi:hypothetical protein